MDPVTILLFIALFGLSAFFSGSELAFMSLADHKISSFVKQKKSGAKTLKRLRDQSDRLLIAILIGNNLVNVFTASLATSLSIDIANSVGSSQSLAIGISTGVITLLLLIFGEIFPKTLATRYAEPISLTTAPFFALLIKILYPFVILIEALMKVFHKGVDELEISEEELESFIDMSHTSGQLSHEEYEKIKNMMDFYEIVVDEVMTPRTKIDAIPNSLTVAEAIDKILEYSHSRIVVYTENIDDAKRVVRGDELLLWSKQGCDDKPLSELELKEITKVPITQPIHKTLELFKKTRQHIALAMDEYGGVDGLISLEDIVEEVFGEIQDETDTEKQSFVKDAEHSYIVQPHVRVGEVLEKFNLDFDMVGIAEEEFDGETLSYFITSHLERFPNEKEEFFLEVDNEDDPYKIGFKVLKIQDDSIEEIRVWKK